MLNGGGGGGGAGISPPATPGPLLHAAENGVETSPAPPPGLGAQGQAQGGAATATTTAEMDMDAARAEVAALLQKHQSEVAILQQHHAGKAQEMAHWYQQQGLGPAGVQQELHKLQTTQQEQHVQLRVMHKRQLDDLPGDN